MYCLLYLYQWNYPGVVTTPTADIITAKLLINSTISTPQARFVTADITIFYLGPPMERYEYMMLPLRIIPMTIIQQYNLLDIVYNEKIYIEIRRGMYSLP